LLAYRQSHVGRKDAAHIKGHLAMCDFCNAELQLLSRHRDDCEVHALGEMPQQLRRLAERLLRKSVPPFKALVDFSGNN